MTKDTCFLRAPLDAQGKPYETCSQALLPGLLLAQSEPELIVLLYDSLLHQNPDTALFICDPAEEGHKDALRTCWEMLGEPTLLVAGPEDLQYLRDQLPEIETRSLYDFLLAANISGGCHRELIRLGEPEGSPFEGDLLALADNMGAVVYRRGGEGMPEEAAGIPFLTSSIQMRNAMKGRGYDALHILELIYGMGASNTHLAHTHEGHDHSHDEAVPALRETVMTEAEVAATEALFDTAVRQQHLQELFQSLQALFWNGA